MHPKWMRSTARSSKWSVHGSPPHHRVLVSSRTLYVELFDRLMPRSRHWRQSRDACRRWRLRLCFRNKDQLCRWQRAPAHGIGKERLHSQSEKWVSDLLQRSPRPWCPLNGFIPYRLRETNGSSSEKLEDLDWRDRGFRKGATCVPQGAHLPEFRQARVLLQPVEAGWWLFVSARGFPSIAVLILPLTFDDSFLDWFLLDTAMTPTRRRTSFSGSMALLGSRTRECMSTGFGSQRLLPVPFLPHNRIFGSRAHQLYSDVFGSVVVRDSSPCLSACDAKS